MTANLFFTLGIGLITASLAGLALFTCYACWFYANSSRRLRSTLQKLNRRATILKQKIDLLEEQSAGYFHVLHDKKWGELQHIYLSLSLCLEDAGALLDKKRVDDAEQLITYVADSWLKPPAHLYTFTSADLTLLVDWESRSDSIVIGIIARLTEASLETRNLGVKRSPNKRPTIYTLAQLRQLVVLPNNRTPRRQSAQSADEGVV